MEAEFAGEALTCGLVESGALFGDLPAGEVESVEDKAGLAEGAGVVVGSLAVGVEREGVCLDCGRSGSGRRLWSC